MEDQVELEIADNGIGFEPEKVNGKGGLGLVSIRERAEMIGARLSIRSVRGKGTTVLVRVKREEKER
jgi:signal transduction histidine kinase